MQIHENKFVKTQYAYDNQQYIIVNKCPHCNLEIHPNVENTMNLENNSFKIRVLSLTCPSCKKEYFILNDFRDDVTANSKFLFSIPQFGFDENSLIKNTSKKFQTVYSQTINAELLNYNDLAYFGYIKSLEILIKDIAMLEHPESEDEILFSNLIACLENFHKTNIHLFSTKLLEVLKNDYLHYQKFQDYKVFSELVKNCINYFLLYLELLLKTFSLNEHQNQIQDI